MGAYLGKHYAAPLARGDGPGDWLDAIIAPPMGVGGNHHRPASGVLRPRETVPDPPAPLEINLPEVSSCGHLARELPYACSDCDACHSVYSILRESRDRRLPPGASGEGVQRVRVGDQCLPDRLAQEGLAMRATRLVSTPAGANAIRWRRVQSWHGQKEC